MKPSAPASSRRRPAGNPMELPRSHSKFSPLVFITLGIPLPAGPCESIFISMIFIHLQTPFPATPLFAHPYKTTGVSQEGIIPTGSALAVQREPQATSFQQFAASWSLLPLFWNLPSFVFNRLQPLFPKYRGYGGAPVTHRTVADTAATLVASSALIPTDSCQPTADCVVAGAHRLGAIARVNPHVLRGEVAGPVARAGCAGVQVHYDGHMVR